MRLEQVLYTATVQATGGRTGTAASADGALSVTLSTPSELGGAGARAPTPNNSSPPAIRRALSAR